MGYSRRMEGLAPAAATESPAVALFDLDGTLTWHDTLVPYLAGYLASRPRLWWRTLRLPPALLAYAITRDRGRLKSALIRALLGGERRRELDAWTQRFVKRLRDRGGLRTAGLETLARHRACGDRLVLLSASPDLYVPQIGESLGFDWVLCTGVAWDGDRLEGHLTTANRRGEEKVRCLEAVRLRYPGLPVAAYGNSSSDLPHLRLTERPLFVNGSRRSRRRAVAGGIPCDDWC